MALRVIHAENALQILTSGQVDAVVSPDGKTFLLRPAQESLRQSERRLQGLIDSLVDAVLVVNRGGMIVSQSRAVGPVLRYEPDELVGKTIFEQVHEDDLQLIHSDFMNVVEGFQESAMVRFRHRAPDGFYHWIEAALGKLRSSTPACVAFSLRRISGLQPGVVEPVKLAETPSLAKDRFLAMLSHELRTPLTPVLLAIGDLQADERFADAMPALTMMRRNVELQAKLLDELTDFAAIGQDKIRPRLHPIDAHELVHFVLEICESQIAAALIEVRLDLQAKEPTVMADSARLQQITWNLIKNAIKFSTPGSSISITSTNDAGGHFVFEIADHGIGIEPDLLSLVFDPFRQGDLSMQSLYGGLGLGMFIAKMLAEAQHGTLTVASEGRGHGAIFRLTLPSRGSGHSQGMEAIQEGRR